MTRLQLVTLAIVSLVGLIFGARIARRRRIALALYWSRSCTGRNWVHAFPSATKSEIRRFLQLFAAAFALPAANILKFLPTDRVLSIYHASSPPEGGIDVLELETLAKHLGTAYRIDLRSIWREDLTLGDLFTSVRRAAT
jgi:propanediol dehydratase small subunit